MDVKERVNAFDAKHGDFVVVNGWILYEDGAMREVDFWGVLKEPPVDVYQSAKLVHRFWELRLALAVEEFKVSRNLI